MASTGHGLQDIFLAGIGAMAITGDKAHEVLDTLVQRGEITVEQGKQIAKEMAKDANEATQSIQEAALQQHLNGMTPEERKAFAAKIANMVEETNAGETDE